MTGVGATGAGGMYEEHSCCEKGLSSRSGEKMAVVCSELEAAMENCQGGKGYSVSLPEHHME